MSAPGANEVARLLRHSGFATLFVGTAGHPVADAEFGGDEPGAPLTRDPRGQWVP